MDFKPILRVVPTIESIALLKRNVDFVSKKKKKSNDFVKLGTGNIVGTALIKEQANLIEGM